MCPKIVQLLGNLATVSNSFANTYISCSQLNDCLEIGQSSDTCLCTTSIALCYSMCVHLCSVLTGNVCITLAWEISTFICGTVSQRPVVVTFWTSFCCSSSNEFNGSHFSACTGIVCVLCLPRMCAQVSNEDTSMLVFSTNQDEVYSWIESIRKVIQ